MTPLDELIHEVLTDEAASHHGPADLASRSMSAGRQLRRRRRAGIVAGSALSCAALVGGSLAVAGAVGSHGGTTPIPPAAQSGGKSHHRGGGSQQTVVTATVQPWRSWTIGRVYGDPPPAGFMGNTPPSSVMASGTLPDGMDFKISTDLNSSSPIDDLFGYQSEPIFGDEPGTGSPVYRADAPYFGIVMMTAGTWDNGNEDGHDGFWLVIVGQPDTTAASYSPDGTTWQPMDVQHGIAVIKMDNPNAAMPKGAELQLSDSSGTYYSGSVDTGLL